MAGVPLSKLEAWLPTGTAVLRAMPNMPAILGSAASALAGGGSASEPDFAWAEAVLSAFGVVARVSEPALDAVTGLSGSGPAYLFLLAEAMIEAGVAEGLDHDVSRLLVTHTLLGSARLLAETGEAPEVLRAAITSPGGTTAAGLQVLDEPPYGRPWSTRWPQPPNGHARSVATNRLWGSHTFHFSHSGVQSYPGGEG